MVTAFSLYGIFSDRGLGLFETWRQQVPDAAWNGVASGAVAAIVSGVFLGLMYGSILLLLRALRDLAMWAMKAQMALEEKRRRPGG